MEVRGAILTWARMTFAQRGVHAKYAAHEGRLHGEAARQYRECSVPLVALYVRPSHFSP